MAEEKPSLLNAWSLDAQLAGNPKFADDDVYNEEEMENSPYPEVCAAVHNYDEDIPANTIRAVSTYSSRTTLKNNVTFHSGP